MSINLLSGVLPFILTLFLQVNITFPEAGLKSDKVTIRGPKQDVDACHKYLQRLHEEMKLNNFSVDVPIYKQNHKFIIGKGGANIKRVSIFYNFKVIIIVLFHYTMLENVLVLNLPRLM